MMTYRVSLSTYAAYNIHNSRLYDLAIITYLEGALAARMGNLAAEYRQDEGDKLCAGVECHRGCCG